MLGFFQDNYLSIHRKLLFIGEKVLFHTKRQGKDARERRKGHPLEGFCQAKKIPLSKKS